MTDALALGIDIGGTSTAFGLVDKRGHIVAQGGMDTKGYATVGLFIKALKKELAPLIKRAGRATIAGVGIGAPMSNYYTGEIANADNLEWHGTIPVTKLIGEALGMKATVTNDANAAAIGEMLYGAARGMRDFVMVTLGTGLGSGFVANGQLIYGHDGFAGELGHTIIEPDGRLCKCGRRGCLEQYCSATGIVLTAEKWLDVRTDESLLRLHKGTITSAMIYEAAKRGDKFALEVFDYTAMILGRSLANTVAITSPQVIVFFGGLAKAGDLLLKPVHKYMEESLHHAFKNKVKLLLSELPDADAAILGASALVWQTAGQE